MAKIANNESMKGPITVSKKSYDVFFEHCSLASCNDELLPKLFLGNCSQEF